MGVMNWINVIRGTAARQELERIKGEYETVVRELSASRQELRKHKEELEDLKLKKKIEDEDIKHLTKIKLEQNAIEHERKVIDMERQKDTAIHAIKQEYADKMQARLIKEADNIKAMYSEILQRLPNINVEMKGKV